MLLLPPNLGSGEKAVGGECGCTGTGCPQGLGLHATHRLRGHAWLKVVASQKEQARAQSESQLSEGRGQARDIKANWPRVLGFLYCVEIPAPLEIEQHDIFCSIANNSWISSHHFSISHLSTTSFPQFICPQLLFGS